MDDDYDDEDDDNDDENSLSRTNRQTHGHNSLLNRNIFCLGLTGGYLDDDDDDDENSVSINKLKNKYKADKGKGAQKEPIYSSDR